ncbi:hypothetical protein ACQUSR_18990 [Streptomyces sp. P1-3]|uniref:hypothetical protein n=1 Tax=Streptomyces sp. P1-3 TaxID=3421658 RepID=UPI003D35F25A
MRFRNVVTVSAAALALGLSMSGSASAADGEFIYSYTAEDNTERHALLVDPPSGECINLPEVQGADMDPADTPLNRTTTSVKVFADQGCQGTAYLIRPNGTGGTHRLKMRSVQFL